MTLATEVSEFMSPPCACGRAGGRACGCAWIRFLAHTRTRTHTHTRERAHTHTVPRTPLVADFHDSLPVKPPAAFLKLEDRAHTLSSHLAQISHP